MAERTRQPLKRMWSSWLAVPVRPASAGPVRYWQDQARLAVKAAIAAVGAWALAARHARESLRWNPRAKGGRGKAGRGVPRPDGAVLDSLEELTARTRAVARSLPEIKDLSSFTGADRPGQETAGRTGQHQTSFSRDYAALLQSLAGPVRQLADLRTSRPRDTLAAARECQRQLEHQAARLPDHSDTIPWSIP